MGRSRQPQHAQETGKVMRGVSLHKYPRGSHSAAAGPAALPTVPCRPRISHGRLLWPGRARPAERPLPGTLQREPRSGWQCPVRRGRAVALSTCSCHESDSTRAHPDGRRVWEA